MAAETLNCHWCGKRNRKASEWEQEGLKGGFYRLCVRCANSRLRNPYNALLPAEGRLRCLTTLPPSSLLPLLPSTGQPARCETTRTTTAPATRRTRNCSYPRPCSPGSRRSPPG